MYFFTADEHYFHKNIIRYSYRPFSSLKEMHEFFINNHNSVVTASDITIHAGDFSFANKERTEEEVIKNLNGSHLFVKGSHDRWLDAPYIWEKNIQGHYIVVCHYAMRVWARSHYNSWQLYGHSHGRLQPEGKQWDVGVDNNHFFPLSFDRIIDIMKDRPNNFNFIKRGRK
jgi:calcineurin-like phosphoesterase family protein